MGLVESGEQPEFFELHRVAPDEAGAMRVDLDVFAELSEHVKVRSDHSEALPCVRGAYH